MYIQQTRHWPAPDKAPELRALLEDWAKNAPARGFRHNLTTPMLYSQGFVLVNGIWHETLADFQSYPQRSRAHPDHKAFTEKQAGLIARREQSLVEVLVPPHLTTPPTVQLRFFFAPALGKVQPVRTLLEERVKALQAAGTRVSLWRRLFHADGPGFTLNFSFDGMDALETWLQDSGREADVQAFSEKVHPLLARMPGSRLYQVLVPMSPL